MSAKISRVCSMIVIAVVLFVLFTPPAQAAPAPVCYRTAAGIVCYPPGQAPAGGSGITPVKRFRG